jgi:hypothetical protein
MVMDEVIHEDAAISSVESVMDAYEESKITL